MSKMGSKLSQQLRETYRLDLTRPLYARIIGCHVTNQFFLCFAISIPLIL